MTVPGLVVADDCGNLRQGDVIEFPSLNFGDGSSADLGVAVLSQTCDVVQPSKARCLVAPVIESNESILRDARKGRKPLHLYLESVDDSELEPCVVDMEQATSVNKSDLVGKPLRARYVSLESSPHASKVGARVGRAFNRFPFPNEVYPFFGNLRSRVQSKSGTVSAFGQAVDLVDDLRISADQWPEPGRNLKLYVIVGEELLIPRDDHDPSWEWSRERVTGWKQGELLSDLSLTRACELLIANLDVDPTTSSILWTKFGECLLSELLLPNLDSEVIDCSVEVLSGVEMTYQQYQRTESLDLEVLSDSTAA